MDGRMGLEAQMQNHTSKTCHIYGRLNAAINIGRRLPDQASRNGGALDTPHNLGDAVHQVERHRGILR